MVAVRRGVLVGQGGAGVLRVVATLRFDAKFAEEPGVAKLINIQL